MTITAWMSLLVFTNTPGRTTLDALTEEIEEARRKTAGAIHRGEKRTVSGLATTT